MSSLTEIPKKELYANDLYLLGSSHNWIVSIFQSPYNQSGVKLKLYLHSDSFVIELFSKLSNFQQSCQSKFCFQVWCYCLSRRLSLTASMEHVFASVFFDSCLGSKLANYCWWQLPRPKCLIFFKVRNFSQMGTAVHTTLIVPLLAKFHEELGKSQQSFHCK